MITADCWFGTVVMITVAYVERNSVKWSVCLVSTSRLPIQGLHDTIPIQFSGKQFIKIKIPDTCAVRLQWMILETTRNDSDRHESVLHKFIFTRKYLKSLRSISASKGSPRKGSPWHIVLILNLTNFPSTNLTFLLGSNLLRVMTGKEAPRMSWG